jgi:hypothetical protein
MVAPLDAPDEPSHFNYIVQVREGYLLPVVDLVSPGGLRTPPSTPLNADVREWFASYDYKFFRSMPYESAQPPLYYWGAALWTRPVGIAPFTLPTLLLAARLFSVLLGTGTVFAIWFACRWVWPENAWLRWAVPGALTLHPEFSFTTATVGNDAGVVFLGACLLAVWAYGLSRGVENRGRRGEFGVVAACAVVTGAGILTKLTFVATVPASLLCLWWLARGRQGRSIRRWAPLAGVYSAVVGAMVLPWVIRNLRVYGEPTGARAIFDLIHRIYWERMGLSEGQVFSQFPAGDFVVRSFRSFWALFGWATVSLSGWVYWLLAGFVAAAVVGGVFALRREGVSLFARRGGRLALLALVTCAFAFANYVGYNSLVEFQPHMRYTFTALAPAVLLLGGGIYSIPVSERWRKVAVGLFLGVLALAQGLSLMAVSEQSARVIQIATGS